MCFWVHIHFSQPRHFETCRPSWSPRRAALMDHCPIIHNWPRKHQSIWPPFGFVIITMERRALYARVKVPCDLLASRCRRCFMAFVVRDRIYWVRVVSILIQCFFLSFFPLYFTGAAHTFDIYGHTSDSRARTHCASCMVFSVQFSTFSESICDESLYPYIHVYSLAALCAKRCEPSVRPRTSSFKHIIGGNIKNQDGISYRLWSSIGSRARELWWPYRFA